MFKSFSKINLSILSLSKLRFDTSNDHQNEKIFCIRYAIRTILVPLRSKSRRRKILLSRSIHAAHLVDRARRSRVREGRAEFHQRRETIPIFVKGMPVLFSWLTKSVRSRRRKENEGEEEGMHGCWYS